MTNIKSVIAELRELLKNPMNQWGQEEMARYDALVNWPSDFVPQLLEYVEELEDAIEQTKVNKIRELRGTCGQDR